MDKFAASAARNIRHNVVPLTDNDSSVACFAVRRTSVIQASAQSTSTFSFHCGSSTRSFNAFVTKPQRENFQLHAFAGRLSDQDDIAVGTADFGLNVLNSIDIWL